MDVGKSRAILPVFAGGRKLWDSPFFRWD